MILVVRCPNCLNVQQLPDTFLDGHSFVEAAPGCGDCAQASVRPRSLYRYVLVDVLPLTHRDVEKIAAAGGDNG